MFKKLILIILSISLVSFAFAADKAGQVVKAKGRVEIVHGEAVMGKRAKSGAELIVKDILRTKRRGFAEVSFVDGTDVKVFEKSRLTINGIERTTDGYNAEIQKGKVLFKVEKMTDVAGDFRVKTTNSIIGVKGTTFGVVSGSLFTIVEVFNGRVEVKAVLDVDSSPEGINQAMGKAASESKGGDTKADEKLLKEAVDEGVVVLNKGDGLRLEADGDMVVFRINKQTSAFGAAGLDDKSNDKSAGEKESEKGEEKPGDNSTDKKGEQEEKAEDKRLFETIGSAITQLGGSDDEQQPVGGLDIGGSAGGDLGGLAVGGIVGAIGAVGGDIGGVESGGGDLGGAVGGVMDGASGEVGGVDVGAVSDVLDSIGVIDTEEQIQQSKGQVNINVHFDK